MMLSLLVNIIAFHNLFSSHNCMSLFTVGYTDNTESQVHSGKYHFVPNHSMVHEDGMDNRLTVNSNALLNYDQRYSFTLTPFLSLMFMSAPLLTRHSTV